MKNFISISILFFLFSSLSVFSQDKDVIYSNLKYINKQFSLHNDYHTVWAVDYGSKELVSYNKFGSRSGKFSDITIGLNEEVTNSLKFGCKSGYCLEQSNGTDKIKFYTMKLRNNISTVIEKFSEIIEEMNGKKVEEKETSSINYSTKYYSKQVKETVESTLNRLTDIFQTENKYKHKWYVNWDKNYMYSKTTSCEVIIPFNKNVSVELKESGYYFKADTKVIREKCTSFDNNVLKTYNNLKTKNAADEVVYLFQEILDLTK